MYDVMILLIRGRSVAETSNDASVLRMRHLECHIAKLRKECY